MTTEPALNDTVASAVAKFDTLDLQHARRVLEAELLDACSNGVQGTRQHEGQLEMLGAIGAELDRRNALLPPPPYVEVDRESVGASTVRLSFSVRVF